MGIKSFGRTSLMLFGRKKKQFQRDAYQVVVEYMAATVYSQTSTPQILNSAIILTNQQFLFNQIHLL